MLTTLLMFIAAIVLSAIAGYYSVIGMTAIFSGAFIPVVLMAGTLETSKVIVASWLYNNWKNTPFLLKTYLTAAVVVLMFITSMGIFGYLSKAHIQQAAAGAQQAAQVQRLQQEIDSQDQIIKIATQRLNDLASGSQSGDAGINARIEQANKVIENANKRVQPKIDDQLSIIDRENAKIESRVADIQTQVADVDKQVAALDEIVKGLVDQQRSVLAQRKRTEQAKEREALAKKKEDLIKQIDQVRNASNPTVDNAKAEINKIRAGVEEEIKQAQAVINDLTSQLGKNINTSKLTADIDEQNARIKSATARLDELTAEKFKIETATRQLEVEVGPIKYIAQMIYGDNVDGMLLEKAVRWIIMTLIFVFDPLAVLMLIASNQGLAEWKAARKSKKETQLSVLDPIVSSPTANVSMQNKRDDDGKKLMEMIQAALNDVSKKEIDASDLAVPVARKAQRSKSKEIDTLPKVQLNVVDSEINEVNNEVKEPETPSQSDSDADRINNTDDLLNKLQRVHASRLQKFNSKPV